jgi:hypothetical protein
MKVQAQTLDYICLFRDKRNYGLNPLVFTMSPLRSGHKGIVSLKLFFKEVLSIGLH